MEKTRRLLKPFCVDAIGRNGLLVKFCTKPVSILEVRFYDGRERKNELKALWIETRRFPAIFLTPRTSCASSLNKTHPTGKETRKE